MKTSIVGKNIRPALFRFILGASMFLFSCSVMTMFGPTTPTPIIPTVTTLATANPSSTQSPIPVYDVGSTIVSPKDSMKSAFVPAGEFLMGSQDGAENEKPVHTVYLDSFWIDKTEVTNGMYTLCVKAGACRPPFETIFYDNPDFVDGPVNYVTWDDANAYCTWADRRLPTEAEWEKAASWDDAKKEKRIYAWGNTFDCTFANIYSEDGVGSGCEGYPVRTASYPLGASFYSALDMIGNVTEWVADLYNETYYQVSPSTNPTGPESGTEHVLRGGSFLNTALEARSTFRQSESFFNSWPTFYDMVGFRCAMNTPN